MLTLRARLAACHAWSRHGATNRSREQLAPPTSAIPEKGDFPMRFRPLVVFTVCACALSNVGWGQQTGQAKDLSGNWIISADLFGTTLDEHMELKQDGEKLSGTYAGDKVTAGTVNGGAIHLVATSDEGTTSDVHATLKDGAITGNTIETDASDKDHPSKYTFTGTR